MGFTRAELDSYRGAVVPDLIGPDLTLLFVGINPGLWTAATQTHFARPGNRFYPALLASGIIERPVSHAQGMPVRDHEYLLGRGLGITNLVAGASARADELTAAELRAGRVRLELLIARHRPRVVAIAGITAYRSAFERPRAVVGRQDESIGEAVLFVVPNPSGLNAHATVSTLAAAYREAAVVAGIVD